MYTSGSEWLDTNNPLCNNLQNTDRNETLKSASQFDKKTENNTLTYIDEMSNDRTAE